MEMEMTKIEKIIIILWAICAFTYAYLDLGR